MKVARMIVQNSLPKASQVPSSRSAISQLASGLVALSLLVSTGLSSAAAEVSDPLEPVNRAVFSFNDTLDVYLFEPIARGYDYITPQPIQRGVHNFFRNIKSPIYVVSDLVQLKFTQAGIHTGRFVVNTTLGGLGFVDVAKSFGMDHHPEDFGTALGYHGVPEGAYIVIPILGPSNVRDVFGRVVDVFLNPIQYITVVSDDGEPVQIGLTALDAVDQRSRLLDAVDSAKETSLDYYSFVKNSYHQIRQNEIYDNDPPEEDESEEPSAPAAPQAAGANAPAPGGVPPQSTSK